MKNNFYFIIFLFLQSHSSILHNQIPLKNFKADPINKGSKRITKKALEKKRKILQEKEAFFRKSLLCEELLDRHKPQETYFTEEESKPEYMIDNLEKTILTNILPHLFLKQEIDFIRLLTKHFDYIKNIFSIKSYQFSKIRDLDPRDFTIAIEECNDYINTIDQFLKNEKTGLSIFIPQRPEYLTAKKLYQEKNILLQEAFNNKRKELYSFEIIIEQLTIIKKEEKRNVKLIEKCINQIKEISRLYNMMSDRVITISVNCEITDRCEEIRYFLDSMARTCKNNILKKYSNSILKNLKAQSATYNKKNTNSLLTNTYSKKGISSSKNFQAIEPVESNIKMEPVEYNIESMNDFFQTFYEENYKEEIENIPSENINDFFTLNNFFEKSNLEYDDFFTLNNFF